MDEYEMQSFWKPEVKLFFWRSTLTPEQKWQWNEAFEKMKVAKSYTIINYTYNF